MGSSPKSPTWKMIGREGREKNKWEKAKAENINWWKQ